MLRLSAANPSTGDGNHPLESAILFCSRAGRNKPILAKGRAQSLRRGGRCRLLDCSVCPGSVGGGHIANNG